MTTLLWIILATVAVSLLSLVGVFALYFSDKFFQKIVTPLVAFAAGALLGGAFLHIIPEIIEETGGGLNVFIWILAGFVLFFFLEQFIQWHHCHKPTSGHVKPVTYLILLADGAHNFIDGLAIGAAFVVDVRLGIVTSFAVMLHEIPQELGDFGILVHGGWKKSKALLFNFFSALTAIAGGLVAFAVSKSLDITFLLAVTAGTFIYIASSDLVPEIKSGKSFSKNAMHFLVFVLGMVLLGVFKVVFE